MLYQLPSGKVINISLEEYLSLSDRELHNLVHSGGGEEPSYNSYFNSKQKKEKRFFTEEEEE